MKNKLDVNFLFFDLDDTLISRRKAFLRYSEDFISEYSGICNSRESCNQIIEYMIKCDDSGKTDRYTFFSALRKYFNLSTEQIMLFADSWPSVFPDYAVVNSETNDVLSYLKNRYQLGLITNGLTISQKRKIETAGIGDYFNTIIISEEIGFSKPDPKIFLYSCRMLNASPLDSAYIGDNYLLDICGAKNVGMKSIWINDSVEEKPCTVHIHNLLELKEYL